MTIREYFQRSKSYAESILFILPLLVLYEVGIALSGTGVENAAGAIMKTPMHLFGKNATLVFNVVVALVFVVALFGACSGRKLEFRIFVPMFLESLLYALLLHPMVGFIIAKVVPFALASGMEEARVFFVKIVLAIGAGVYEEIVYRLLLLSLLFYVFRKSFEIRESIAATLTILIASLIFAGMHYVGGFGDSLMASSFVFRFLCGLALSSLFIFRGLGIAVYTHALYDFIYVIWLSG
ncbi:MAG: CPBP family intramembrane glutamic endopeptidase [Planctomycetota bacterium]